MKEKRNRKFFIFACFLAAACMFPQLRPGLRRADAAATASIDRSEQWHADGGGVTVMKSANDSDYAHNT